MNINEITNNLLQVFDKRFMVMTGSLIIATKTGIDIKLPKITGNKKNSIAIDYNENNDTFTMKFYNFNRRKLELTMLSKHEDIYINDLKSIFKNETGLDTNL